MDPDVAYIAVLKAALVGDIDTAKAIPSDGTGDAAKGGSDDPSETFRRADA